MARNYREGRERKALPMAVLEIQDEREVVALNAVLGNVDDGADVIWPGAFAKTLAERFHRVRVLWQHDASQPPIGAPAWAKEVTREELPEEVRGAFPEALGGLVSKIAYLDTPRGSEVLAGIKAGAIVENSIGYDAVKFDFEERDEGQVRNLRELALWDLSPVNWGMNPGAVTMDFKTAVDELVAALRSPDPEAVARVLEELKAMGALDVLLKAAGLVNDSQSEPEDEDEPEDDGESLPLAGNPLEVTRLRWLLLELENQL